MVFVAGEPQAGPRRGVQPVDPVLVQFWFDLSSCALTVWWAGSARPTELSFKKLEGRRGSRYKIAPNLLLIYLGTSTNDAYSHRTSVYCEVLAWLGHGTQTVG